MPDSFAGLPDIFTALQPLLMMLSLGNRALVSRPDDPLPRALAEFTTFGEEEVERFAHLSDSAGVYTLLQDAPELFANYVLLGQLVFASPLGNSLAAYVTPDAAADADEVAQRRQQLLAYVAHYAPVQSELLENMLLDRCDDDFRADLARMRADFRAAAEAVFTDWQHSLGALVLSAPAPVLPFDEEEGGWSIEPLAVQLNTLALALSTVLLLPAMSPTRFAEAVQRLPDFHPQRLEELRAYLDAAEPEQTLDLTRTQGLLLYLAAHLVLLTLFHDLLDGEGLDDLLAQQQEAGEATPELVTLVRDATAGILSAYIHLVRENEADTADFQALEARLAPVLALGAT